MCVVYACFLPVFNVPTDVTYHDTMAEALSECVRKTRETGKFYRARRRDDDTCKIEEK